MISFYIPKGSSAMKLLQKAGYEMHRYGYFQGGFVREVRSDLRFHAHVKGDDENMIELHTDLTINGYHNVLKRNLRAEKLERQAICRGVPKQPVVPPPPPKKPDIRPKKRPKKEYASNLKEIQKGPHVLPPAKPVIISPCQSWRSRIMIFVRRLSLLKRT